MNIGVLISGSGNNLQALIDGSTRNELGPARLTVVRCNVPDCQALSRAAPAGQPTFLVDHRDHSDRAAFDRALVEALRAHQVDLVVLAGFMRVLSGELLDAFPGRVINIHPALLPAFPGVHGASRRTTRPSRSPAARVHFVDRGVDTGPIIAQAAVQLQDDDDDEALRARILAEEHRLLPAVVRAIAERRVVVEGRRVRVLGAAPGNAPLRSL